jgi:acyl dehydratase
MASDQARGLEVLAPGEQLGPSDWVTVTQEMISSFGAATLDMDPMHVDPAWAARGPFGNTIAFGFLTMSLLTNLLHQAMGTSSERYDPSLGYFLNYGMDRVRLIAPVPVGSRVRGVFKVAEIREDTHGRRIVKLIATIECDGAERPAVYAEWLACWVPPETAS